MLVRRAVLLLVVVMTAMLLVAAPVSRAQGSSPRTVTNFIAALNNSDATTAASLTAPDFTLTLADGTTATGSDALSLLATLSTPITIVSASPASHMINAVLQFGSDPPVPVTFTGEGGVIGSMTISPPQS